MHQYLIVVLLYAYTLIAKVAGQLLSRVT